MESTYANRHPMQLLTPPENVELSESEINIQQLNRSSMRERTGSRTPRGAIPPGRPFQTTVPGGRRERLVPIGPGSCRENNVRTLLRQRQN